jgi:hypothetical protein
MIAVGCRGKGSATVRALYDVVTAFDYSNKGRAQ